MFGRNSEMTLTQRHYKCKYISISVDSETDHYEVSKLCNLVGNNSKRNMTFLRKFGLILWKNWILRKRHFIITGLEIILPLFFTLLLVTLRSSGGDSFKITYINDSVVYPKILVAPPSYMLMSSNVTLKPSKNVTIMYSPDNPLTQRMMNYLKEVVESARGQSERSPVRFDDIYDDGSDYTGVRVTLLGLSDEASMDKMAKKADMERDDTLFGGISFVNDFPLDGSIPENLHYRIRLRATFAGFGGLHYWQTDRLTPFASPGPNDANGMIYIGSQFLLCQHLVAMKFIEMASKTNLSDRISVYSQKFPYPPYYEDAGFNQVMQSILPLFIILSYIFISPSLIKKVVVEKELGTKELMKLMGLPGWIQWLGWFVSNFIMMGISALIIVLLLCCASETPVLSRSAPELVYIVFLLYIASAIAFCFFISSLFSKPTVATAVGVIAWILTYSVPYDILSQKYDQLSLTQKLTAALLPNLCMGWAIRVIASFEGRNLGLQWHYIAEPAYKGENMCMLHVMLMFILDTIIFGILTWYVDNVFPGKFGVRKPWYFFVTKSYWCAQQVTDSNFENLTPHPNSPNFDIDPLGLTPTIVIKNLTKSFGQSKLAVDNLSLNFYEGQITALLGHNGAGKTTTMSMLTGMFSPTKGTAMINGYDIRTHIDAARENIGLCPQHNMLFDILTVKEHLMFFGKLKKLGGKALDSEVDTLIKKLQLWEKRNTLAKDLSGGMKRKLSLGISLIGGSKVIMLDEPTSGLDPEARRAIWDLLQEIRVGRCVILTTHFMEEADVLGDRIAIMAQGRVKCCGTPYFLKKRFGAGYHLNISKTASCNLPQLTSVIQRHLADAYISSNVNNELSYTLPAEKTGLFSPMFEELENNLPLLGIHGFGVSVTTMEEVFLKVGTMAERDDDELENGSKSESHQLVAVDDSSNASIQHNTGIKLALQQLWGLLMKRWHYAYRRWVLIIAQVIMPVIMVFLALYVNNKIDEAKAEEPARLMDIEQYGSTIAVENHTANADEEAFAEAYKTVFPSSSTVHATKDVVEYLIKMGEDHFDAYREKHIVAANFMSGENGTSKITALYNGVYLHTLPLAVNLIHNSILHRQMNSRQWSIAVENAPLPVDPEVASDFGEIMKMFKSMMMGIFIPIGLSFLSSSFVVFPIQERTSKSKHLQLMTGVGGVLFWAASFLWDYVIHFVCSCLILLVFATMDDSKMFSGKDQLGVVFSLLIAYGWAAIPFSYMVSFICKLPASGFAVLTVLNMIAGMILSMMVFFFKFVGGPSLQNASKFLQWIFRLLPNYTVTIAFMNMPQIAINNNKCDLYDEDDLAYKCNQLHVNPNVLPCCPDCGDDCLVRLPYCGWEFPGIGQEVFMLAMDGVFYLFLLFLVEHGIIYKGWYNAKSVFSSVLRFRTTNVLDSDVTQTFIDADVANEKSRIERLFATTTPSDDALLIHDLTKQFWGLRAVDHLSFGVKNSECFGLLGINGAGKTTTFRMLTGDEVMTIGEAYLHGVSLKGDRGKFLKQISYCPQFDAILDHLTGRETLLLFARLRGIPESEIKGIVNSFIDKFDLTDHADKITMAYSGGNKRKLSAAIAFIGNPCMVFLDEPTTGVDPVARRKLWTILLAAKNSGTSLILTSHSMEECEVLCDRLAIMVNGTFKCLGGIQHLKSKFGQGFTIIAKMSAIADSNQQAIVQQNLQQFMSSKFPGCVLKDVHQGLVHYHITDIQTPWRYLFATMEEAKQTFGLEDYSVSQTSLEQVFLSFAQQQRIIADPNITITAPA